MSEPKTTTTDPTKPATAPAPAKPAKAIEYTQRQQLWLSIFTAALAGAAGDKNVTFKAHVMNAIDTANKGIATVEAALALI